MRPVCNRIDKLLHKLGAIAAITVEEHDDVAFRRKRAGASYACAAVTVLWLRYNFCARSSRTVRSLISAAVIHHDDLGRDFCRGDFAHHSRNRLFLVKCRDDDRYVAHCKTSHALVK